MPKYLPFDFEALTAEPDAARWLVAWVAQAIEREAWLERDAIALQAIVEQASPDDLAALRHAHTHGADALPDAMHPAYEILRDTERWVPSPETFAFAQKMRMEGGYVGEDDDGRTVWTTTGGGTFLVDPTEPVPDNAIRH